MRANTKPLVWKLLKPVSFVNSHDHPVIQLADVIAGTAVALFSAPLAGQNHVEELAKSVSQHGLNDSILPDADIIDLSNRSAAVNNLILYDLEKHADPYKNLGAIYRLAEVSWAKGEYRFLRGEAEK
jgi:Protein of unknown function (DUF3800)